MGINLSAGNVLRRLPIKIRLPLPTPHPSSPGAIRPGYTPFEILKTLLLLLAALGVSGTLLFASGLISMWAKLGLATIMTCCCLSCLGPIVASRSAKAPPAVDATGMLREPATYATPSAVGPPRDTPAITARRDAIKALNEKIIAPLFWYTLLGFPGMTMYAVGAFLGHSKRHGLTPRRRASTLILDALSYIPAWATLLLICISCGTPRRIRTAWQKVRHAKSIKRDFAEALSTAIIAPRAGMAALDVGLPVGIALSPGKRNSAKRIWFSTTMGGRILAIAIALGVALSMLIALAKS